MLDFSVTFIITIINIAVLFFILRALLFKKVTKFMDERAKRIQDSIDQAEKDKNQAKAMLAQYEAQLKTAETEAESIISNAKETARIEAEKIIAGNRITLDTDLANARRRLELERQAAMAAFRKEAAALVVEASGRLLGREIRNEDNMVYASHLLEEILQEAAPQEAPDETAPYKAGEK